MINRDVIPGEELTLARTRFENASPQEVIAWALDRFEPDRRVVVTGLQADGVAVADMAIAVDPAVRLVTIDTGRLPEATYRYIDQLGTHWGRDIEVASPAYAEVESFVGTHGSDPFRRSLELRLECCHIRKVAPLERLLSEVDCWLTGLRRGQSVQRSSTSFIEVDLRHGGVIKVNPVAAWTEAEVARYLSDRGVPTHPLYEAGYRSIGCDPCTRAVGPEEDPRGGRWWWEDGVEKECGMHATPQRIAIVTGRAAATTTDLPPAGVAR